MAGAAVDADPASPCPHGKDARASWVHLAWEQGSVALDGPRLEAVVGCSHAKARGGANTDNWDIEYAKHTLAFPRLPRVWVFVPSTRLTTAVLWLLTVLPFAP